MLCENCKKREANISYKENINGVKRELHLCEECAKRLGITEKIDLKLPTFDFANLFGSFLEDLSHTSDFIPLLDEVEKIRCDSCNSSFDDIINTGKFGCANCYDVFEDRMDPILKKLQVSNKHRGRLGKVLNNKLENMPKEENEKKENNKENQLEKLQEKLKQVIKEEKYEEAAKIRDEINKIKKENK